MNPSYEADKAKGILTEDTAQELIEALWLKYSEWVWTISANTADYFAGYNQFQNLTVGGKTREGLDATNDITYMAVSYTHLDVYKRQVWRHYRTLDIYRH